VTRTTETREETVRHDEKCSVVGWGWSAQSYRVFTSQHARPFQIVKIVVRGRTDELAMSNSKGKRRNSSRCRGFETADSNRLKKYTLLSKKSHVLSWRLNFRPPYISLRTNFGQKFQKLWWKIANVNSRLQNANYIKTSSNHRLESAGLNALEELLLMRALFWKRDRKLALLSTLTS